MLLRPFFALVAPSAPVDRMADHRAVSQRRRPTPSKLSLRHTQHSEIFGQVRPFRELCEPVAPKRVRTVSPPPRPAPPIAVQRALQKPVKGRTQRPPLPKHSPAVKSPLSGLQRTSHHLTTHPK